jgi:predicted nucleic acid-binding protein
MILADTSIWVDYLRGGSREMEKLLKNGQIAMHPFIVAEIALGSLRNRRDRLEDMEALLEVKVAQLSEVRHMIPIQKSAPREKSPCGGGEFSQSS